MRRSLWIGLAAILALLVVSPSPRLDVDIFNLLPRDSEQVEGLRVYQQRFGASDDLILLVKAMDADATLDSAGQLAEGIRTAGLSPRVVWRSPFEPGSAETAELIAYLWLNQPPDDFSAMADRFSADRLEPGLQDVLERMAVSFQPLEVATLGSDPFELSSVFGRAELPLAPSRDDPFGSSDGRARIVIVAAPRGTRDYLATRRWVDEVRAFVDDWRRARPRVTVGVTGNPSFVAESGDMMVSDLAAASLGAMLVVVGLFWFAHRRWRPLGVLVGLLLLVLAMTATAGGLVFGGLHAVSLGFAAILLGLAADYGLILYQESRSHPDRSIDVHRRAVAPAIGWSALTTAGAFFMISRSSLPGLSQLGVLVAVGILIAAAMMLAYFLPLAGSGPSARPSPPRWSALPARHAVGLTAAAALASAATLAVSGIDADPDARSLNFQASTSRTVLEEISREIGGFDDDHWLVFDGGSEDDVRRQLAAAAAPLKAAVDRGVLVDYLLPSAVWPDPAAQQANRDKLRWLSRQGEIVLAALRAAGFQDVRMTETVFDAWRRYARVDGTVWPGGADTSWLLRRFVSREDGRVAALGRLRPAADASVSSLNDLKQALVEVNGGSLVSWRLLAESLLAAMKRDVERVLLPMSLVLLLLLFLAYRNLRDVLLSIGALTLSMIALLAVMALLGWSWNLMNVMALPMLFGAGIDYSIHVQLSMRRHGGDTGVVRNTVGRAILLCAASTAAGFATLGFAGNAGIASLGKVCAVGIAITGITAVFLLPAWCRIMTRAVNPGSA